jgi:hypothetical protein
MGAARLRCKWDEIRSAVRSKILCWVCMVIPHVPKKRGAPAVKPAPLDASYGLEDV